MRWSHDPLSLRFLSQLSSCRQLLLRKAARAQAILQRVSARHSALRDLEYEEAVELSSPGQQRTPRAETSTSRPPKEIRCRRQMCFRGTPAATVDSSAEDLQIVHLHPGVARNAISIREDHGMIRVSDLLAGVDADKSSHWSLFSFRVTPMCLLDSRD